MSLARRLPSLDVEHVLPSLLPYDAPKIFFLSPPTVRSPNCNISQIPSLRPLPESQCRVTFLACSYLRSSSNSNPMVVAKLALELSSVRAFTPHNADPGMIAVLSRK